MKAENIRLTKDDIIRKIELLEQQYAESNNEMQILLRKVELIEEYFNENNKL